MVNNNPHCHSCGLRLEFPEDEVSDVYDGRMLYFHRWCHRQWYRELQDERIRRKELEEFFG